MRDVVQMARREKSRIKQRQFSFPYAVGSISGEEFFPFQDFCRGCFKAQLPNRGLVAHDFLLQAAQFREPRG